MKSREMALCGVLCALAAALLTLGGVIPAATFCAPVLAMAALLPVLEEAGPWAAGTAWMAVSLLALALDPDREAALVGSTNMDYRTFQLHYECGVLLYHTPVVEDLLEDMDGILAQSAPYTLEDWNRRPWLRRMCASVFRLGSIWL